MITVSNFFQFTKALTAYVNGLFTCKSVETKKITIFPFLQINEILITAQRQRQTKALTTYVTVKSEANRDRGAGGAGGAMPPPSLFAADAVSKGVPRP